MLFLSILCCSLTGVHSYRCRSEVGNGRLAYKRLKKINGYNRFFKEKYKENWRKVEARLQGIATDDKSVELDTKNIIRPWINRDIEPLLEKLIRTI